MSEYRINVVILKCPPGGMFHFGKIALDADTSLNETDILPHSDTLYSAIIATAFKVYGEEAKEVLEWFETGSILLSSACYCIELNYEEQQIKDYKYFLPKPVFFDLHIREEELTQTDAKALTKISFISPAILNTGILPNEWQGSTVHLLKKQFVLERGELDTAVANRITFFDKVTLPKVAVHKKTQEDSLFFQTNIQISDNEPLEVEGFGKIKPYIHFYFLVRHQLNEKQFNKLKTIIEILADDGIGGERSVGCGQLSGIEFIENPSDFKKLAAIESEYQVSLSLINPSPEEFGNLKAYKLITRGGRRIPFPKANKDKEYDKKSKLKRIKMIAEGALLNGEIKGTIPSIAPEGSILPFLRYGKAFLYPIKSSIVPDALKPRENKVEEPIKSTKITPAIYDPFS